MVAVDNVDSSVIAAFDQRNCHVPGGVMIEAAAGSLLISTSNDLTMILCLITNEAASRHFPFLALLGFSALCSWR